LVADVAASSRSYAPVVRIFALVLAVTMACGAQPTPSAAAPTPGASASTHGASAPAEAAATTPPTATPAARSPVPSQTPTRTPELTRSPSARAIGAAFSFRDGDRWVLGYIDGRLVLLPNRGAPVSLKLSLPASISEITFTDALHGWALGRVESVGFIPGCQHAGTTCHDVIVATADGGRTWSTVRSIYTTGATGFTFNGLQFVDAKHGWTVQFLDSCSQSCAGEMLATDDGGATWSVRSRANGVFTAFKFVDAMRGWAIESSWWTDADADAKTTRLLATSDGGRTWTRQLDSVSAYDIFALDRAHAWALARQTSCGPTCAVTPVELYRTTDGEHWSLAAKDLDSLPCAGHALFGPVFVDADRGLIASGGRELGDSGGILTTRDGGVTWSCASSQPNPANAQQHPLVVGDSVAVITMGSDGSDHLFMTTDLGAHWTEREPSGS
jgi:photosystem II stability/assembly factor-like uncharacterized protein